MGVSENLSEEPYYRTKGKRDGEHRRKECFVVDDVPDGITGV